MLKIHLTKHRLRLLANKHANELLPLVNSRLKRPENAFLTSYFNSDEKIKTLLKCPPARLNKLNDKLLSIIAKQNHLNLGLITPAIKRVFNYDYFASKEKTGYNAFNLCRSLDLFTCPYCNVSSIVTLYNEQSEEDLLRPPLDHFYCASEFPMLAMCFYNLVPACTPCNTTFKKDEIVALSNHLHPYIAGFEDECTFNFSGFKELDDIFIPKKGTTIELIIENPGNDPRFDGNVELFKLGKLYKKHITTAKEILNKARMHSKADLESTRKLLGGSMLPPFQSIFNTKFNLSTLHENPFSKLTRDLTSKYCSEDLKKELKMK